MPESGKYLLVFCQFVPDVKVLCSFIKVMTKEHNLSKTIIVGGMHDGCECHDVVYLQNDQSELDGWLIFLEYVLKEKLKVHTIFYQTLDRRDSIRYRYLPSIIHLSEVKMVSPVETKRLLNGKLSLNPEKNERIYQSLEKTVIYEITNPTYIYNEILGTIILKLRSSITSVLHLLAEFDTQNSDIRGLFINILAITNDLIDISNFSNNKISKTKSTFKINQLMTDCADCVTKDARDKNLHFNWEITPKLQNKTLDSDYNKTKQLLLNILNNAIKFTQVGGVHVTIDNFTTEEYNQCPFTLDVGQKYVMFTVKDTGMGIKNEEKYSLNTILHLPEE